MTNVNFGQWTDGGDGDTQSPAGTPWALDGAHDSGEDRILRQIDLERVVERATSVTPCGMRGIEVHVPRYPALDKQLDRFTERLVHIMIASPDDGASSATRAYITSRRIQLAHQAGNDADLLLSPRFARALATELDFWLRGQSTDHVLRPLTLGLLRATEKRGRK